MKNLLKIISKLLYPFKRKKSILIIETHYPSGSNTFALIPELENRGVKFDVESYPNYKGGNLFVYKVKLALFHIKVSMYDIVLNTNGYVKIRQKQILIDFWHGVPVKSMLFMETNKKHASVNKRHNMDYLITSSKLESTLLSSCMFIPFRKHRILGSPRLDLMNNGKGKIVDILDEKNKSKIDSETKIGLFMPTFRQSSNRALDGLVRDNIFNIAKFDFEKFNAYLEINNIVIVVKKHPLDNRSLGEGKNIVSIDENKLINSKQDLYSFFNDTDFLVTDYSSVMMDYVELNKPIILLAPDHEEYSNTRGFLFNPYTRFIDLDFIVTQEEFENELSKLRNEENNEIKLGSKIHEVNGDISKNIVDWLIGLRKEEHL